MTLHKLFSAALGLTFIAAVLAPIMPTAAVAADQRSMLAKRGVQPEPIYNPTTKSYFQRRTDMPDLGGHGWLKAQKKSSSLKYKGVRGRLAIVKDLETHSFLRANFQFDSTTWIGLRFYCSVRKLVWVDGSEHKRSSFKAWHRQWYRNAEVRCSNQNGLGFMPVYYLSNEKGFKWQAAGPVKGGFNSYLVEYPTGKEATEAKN